MAPDADRRPRASSPLRPHSRALALLLLIALPSALRAAPATDASAFFGKDTTSEAALMGIFYDLKQTPQRTATGVDVSSYVTVLDDFVSKGLSEEVMNQYYRTSKPVYTTQIYIPMMSANEAPKAFGVAKIVKPSRWIIHYKGQVSPPEDGAYRFLGYADDVIFVAVNGPLVLNGSRDSFNKLLKKTKWNPTDKLRDYRVGNGNLIAGDWLNLTAAQPVDIDIIIGEHPGGDFCAFLYYQKQGAAYPAVNGKQALPLFQVAPYAGVLPANGGGPAIVNQAFWKCYQ